jgi:Zn-dependent metalloprotease
MRRSGRMAWMSVLCACAALAQAQDSGEVRVRASSAEQAQQVAGAIETLVRSGELHVRQIQQDTILPGRRHQRLAQSHEGVPIWGAELVRQIDGAGRVVSIFGAYHRSVAVGVSPLQTVEQARATVAATGARPVSAAAPTLAILPEDGAYRLVWVVAGLTRSDVRQYFVDARVGGVVHAESLIRRQTAAVGSGLCARRRQRLDRRPGRRCTRLHGLRLRLLLQASRSPLVE